MARAVPPRKSSRKVALNAAAHPHPALFYRVHSLLHTMRAIQAHEDQLCTLHNELRTSNAVTPGMTAELRQLLEDLPSAEYLDDLDALRHALGVATRPARPKAPAPNTKTKPARKQASPESSSQGRSKASGNNHKVTSVRPVSRKRVTSGTAATGASPASRKAGSRRVSTARKGP